MKEKTPKQIKIEETTRETRRRRKELVCKTFIIKLQKNKINNKFKQQFDQMFREGKYFYNHCIDELNKKEVVDTKVKEVEILVENKPEIRKLEVLSATCKQEIYKEIKVNLGTLSELKKKGMKVGRLNFKSQINSIPLRKYDKDFSIDFKKNKIRITGFNTKNYKYPKWFKVNGLNQINQTDEISNAVLVRKDKDLYLHITIFRAKKPNKEKNLIVGIDFGIKSQLTLSNGVEIKYNVSIPESIKRLDKKIKRKVKNFDKKTNKLVDKLQIITKNKQKLLEKRRKIYQKLTNKKNDIQNKICAYLITNYDFVAIQDENVKGWTKRFGRKINETGIGGIIRELKEKSSLTLVVDRWFASTQTCPICNERTKIELSERVYCCESCKYTEHTDLKSAICIRNKAYEDKFDQTIPLGQRELLSLGITQETLETNQENAIMTLGAISGVVVSLIDLDTRSF